MDGVGVIMVSDQDISVAISGCNLEPSYLVRVIYSYYIHCLEEDNIGVFLLPGWWELVNTTIDSEEHVDAMTWLRNDSKKQVDEISDYRKLVVDGSDSKRDPSVANHVTNRISASDTTNIISTQKLFINPTIQAVFQPITSLVNAEVEVAQEILSPRQTSLPQANVTDAARPCARIFRTTGNIIGTERERATPRDASSSKMRYRANCQSPMFVATSVPPT